MDNETTRCKMPSNSIERIVIFISDIFEKIMLSDAPPFIIKNKQLTKQDLFLKIKEKVDISIIDDKVKKLNEDFTKLFTIKNNYPNLLLKINRILLIFGEEKITKIYELVKYIANIQTSKINNIQLITRDKHSNKDCSNEHYSNTNKTLEEKEEFKDFEKIKSFKNKDLYKTINYSNITNISEIQRKHNCLRNSATKSQNSCDSFGTKESSSNAHPGMINIKCIKDKNFESRRFDSVIKMNSKEKNFGAKEILENKFANENKDKIINNAPLILKEKMNFNNDKGNFNNCEFKTNNKLAEKELFSRDKFDNYNEIENYTINSEDKNKNGDFKELRVSEKYYNLINNQKQDILKLNGTYNNLINTISNTETTEYLGRKTLRDYTISSERSFTDDNNHRLKNTDNNTNNKTFDKFINEEKNKSSDKKQFLELNENTDPKANFNYSQIQNKLKKSSELNKKKENISAEKEGNKEIINKNSPKSRKTSDLFSNKRFNYLFNLDCNFENAEDMFNLDNMSNGIFSSKEITFDENYNSCGEEQDKIIPIEDFKENEIKESSNINNNYYRDSVNNEEFSNLKTNKNSNNYNEDKIDSGSLQLYKNKSNKQTLNNSYKIINEKPFYEKKNMSTLKKFFNQKTKNDNKTIKSIDDSTTVSTQFTKDKNSTKNSQKSQTHYSDRNKFSEISQTQTTNNNPVNINNCNLETPNKILLLSLNKNKNYLLEKDNNYSNANKTYSVHSESTSGKCANYNRVYINNSNQLANSKSYNIKTVLNQNPNKKIGDNNNNFEKEKNENTEIMSNISLNLNCSSTSKEKNLNSLCIQNDFKKSFSDKGDSQSNEIYKNLLATAKYFDLDG